MTDAKTMMELVTSIALGHVRVVHLDAANEWAPYKTDIVVAALRAQAANAQADASGREATPQEVQEACAQVADRAAERPLEVTPGTMARNIAKAIRALIPPATQPQADGVREALEDLRTHREIWRSALLDKQMPFGSDDNDSYWEHELKAFDRTFAALASEGKR